MPTFAVRLGHGPAWDPARPVREQDGWDAHAAFMDGLVADGTILLGGPVGEGEPDRREQTLHAVRAADEAEVRRRLGDDPWFRAGLLAVDTVEPWTLWLGPAQGDQRGPGTTVRARGTVPAVTHRVLLREAVIDVPHTAHDATRDFWAAALGAHARRLPDAPEFTALDGAAALPMVGLQDTGTGRNGRAVDPARVHLDLESDDVDAEVARLIALGAVRVADGRGWVVLRDPAGLLFCVTGVESPDFAERSMVVGQHDGPAA